MVNQAARAQNKAIQFAVFVQLLDTVENTGNHIVTTGSLTTGKDYTHIHSREINGLIGIFELNQRHPISIGKQFLDFFGTGRSLIQQTFDRYKKIVPIENIFITTNVLYKELIQEQLPELDKSQILLEPTRRNTAPCIAWASYHIKKLNPNANVIVAPSDHLILKEDEFKDAILKGLEFVSNSPQLLTLGLSLIHI